MPGVFLSNTQRRKPAAQLVSKLPRGLRLLCLFFLGAFSGHAAFAAQTALFDVRAFRPYGGPVSADKATDAATAAARLALPFEAMRQFKDDPLMAFALGNDPCQGPQNPATSLARKHPQAFIYPLLRVENLEFFVSSSQPEQGMEVKISASRAENYQAIMQELLRSPDLLELYIPGLTQARQNLDAYDASAKKILQASREKGQGIKKIPAGSGNRAEQATEAAWTAEITERLDALRSSLKYLDALPMLLGPNKNLEQASRQLQEAVLLDENNPLALCALGDALLQLNSLDEAAELIERSLKLQESARAHYLRGVIHLQDKLQALALKDFSEAIRLAPYNQSYWSARASTYLIQNSLPEMCADFAEACRLGDCAGLSWAIKQNKCSQPAGN